MTKIRPWYGGDLVRCAHRRGGAADGPTDCSVRDRSVRRERRPDAWHSGDLKVLRCAGCPGEGASGPDAEGGAARARLALICFNVHMFESEKLQKFE
jgi:hypothetical protein